MKTSGQDQLKVSIVTFLMCVIQVNAVTLTITASPPNAYESTPASLTCSIPAFTGGAEWIKNGVSLTQCQSSSCFPPGTGRYLYSATPTNITVAISSLDRTQDETNWTCAHNAGVDRGVHSLIVYKNLSAMSINGPTSSTISNSVTVHLSVTTGCIHPSSSSSFTITWEYVEAGTTAGKLFGKGTTQSFTSLGGCSNVNEDNLMLNLSITNKMNTGTTTLYISQIRMTFTMAGRSVSDSLNVTYNVIGSANCALESFLGLALGDGLGNDAICIICLIVIVIFGKPDADNPKKGASKLILGFGFGIICVACIVCIVILVTIGEPCALKFAIGLGLGLGIPFAGCIIVIVILVKKGVKKASAPENGNAKSGSRSDVSRKDVEIQLEEKGVKSNEERPLVNHNRIGNKDDSEAEQVLSKPFDPKERRPLPPLNKEVKDKPTHRPQPIPSGKNDVKDKNSRGLSANFDDTQGLASEITRPSKLPPIEFQVQSTVQEEDTSEEPKKTKKNKRKKEKIDEEKHADKTAK